MTGSLPSEAGTAPVTEDVASTEIQGSVTPSDSPSDDVGAKGPISVFDAVSSALKAEPKAEGSPTSTPDQNAPGKGTAEAEPPLPERPDAAEMNSLHSRTRRRVKQLLGKWDEAKAESDSLRPLADRMRQINTFIDQSGLTHAEVDSGFQIMRLMKNDPFAAREALAPMMAALDKACGVELPADLRQKVEHGFVDEATARRTAEAEARARLSSQAHTRTVEQVQERQQAETHQRHVGSVTAAVKEFQSSWQRTDPDFAVLYPRVMKEVRLKFADMRERGETITDPAQAVKIVEDAKKAVQADLKQFVRRTDPINPLPSGTVSVTAGVKPKTMAEAVAQGVALRV